MVDVLALGTWADTDKLINARQYGLLTFAERGTAGKDYRALSDAINRLASTYFMAYVKSKGYTYFRLFNFCSIDKTPGPNGLLLSCETALSDLVFNAAGAKSILKNNVGRVRALPIPEAEYDFDIPPDLAKLHIAKENF